MPDQECETFVSDCHVRAAVDLISHTWDPVVLSALRLGPSRRMILLDRVAGVSDKVVTESLQRLISRRLVTRAASGSGATYELTPLGESFASGPLAHLAQWAAENREDLSATA